MRDRFPNIYETCLRFGIDITKEPIPVVPAAHYQCGGVLTDVNGAHQPARASTPSAKWPAPACTAQTGWPAIRCSKPLRPGAPRCAAIVARRTRSPGATDIADLPPWKSGDAADVDELVVIYHNWDEIRRLMWDYVGIVRTGKRLQRASTRLRNLRARDPGILLELQDHHRPPGTAQSRHRGRPDRGQRPRAKKAAACTTPSIIPKRSTGTCRTAPCCGGSSLNAPVGIHAHFRLDGDGWLEYTATRFLRYASGEVSISGVVGWQCSLRFSPRRRTPSPPIKAARISPAMP